MPWRVTTRAVCNKSIVYCVSHLAGWMGISRVVVAAGIGDLRKTFWNRNWGLYYSMMCFNNILADVLSASSGS